MVFIIDSVSYTSLVVRYSDRMLALACLYLASRITNQPLALFSNMADMENIKGFH